MVRILLFFSWGIDEMLRWAGERLQHTKNPYILNPHTLNPHIAAGSGGAAEMQMLEGGEHVLPSLLLLSLAGQSGAAAAGSNDDEGPHDMPADGENTSVVLLGY